MSQSMTSGTPQVRSDFRTIEDRVLDALHSSIEKWGLDKVTIDDVAQVSGVSRATIYRMFPGGREVLFEALRVRNLNEFFTGLRSAVDSSASLLDLVVDITVHATRELRSDEQLVAMLANEEANLTPGPISKTLKETITTKKKPTFLAEVGFLSQSKIVYSSMI